ncbi:MULTISPECIES: ATP-binding protein [Edwardsiella]|uniref:Anti-sigma regulatory factor (Ser/Thr protein kinase) n=2 Tax=Edwardsiella anguillarum TaxID=1821960 RepID=A0A076LKB5_9GAMM|nr:MULTISPECIES: ATP-binding protein [Edwardsiella]AKM47126.1 anti-sigma regulatory factor [Edwardsiella sp. EA181011]GAJ67422.1 anti-sigma regulatory factor [Edwardsiella piscicida]AIJ07257.1 Anti-sigma regulatory factor (Ser/Thr protein kinase) [Edwardsiella anguillarum ET080813]AKR78592.1 ATP-binding protein [Edwardsiella sp. LADL05-105]KAB0590899.1 ATP-binding protein [Edwardsiella anguillarum]
MKLRTYSFPLAATLDSLAPLGAALQEFFSGAPPDVLFQLELAANESFSNIVRHGQAGAHPVAVTLTRHPRHLEVVLRDRGQPIPRGALRPTAPDPHMDDPCSWPEHGMGMLLIRQMTDEYHYRYGAGGNEQRLIKYLPLGGGTCAP